MLQNVGDVAEMLQFPYNSAADKVLGYLYLGCFIFGTFANLAAVLFFCEQHTHTNNKLFFKKLYQLISITDFMVCVTVFPVSEAFLTGRRSLLLDNPVFCSMWGLLWEIIPSVSVVLVALLLFSRMISLFYPLQQLNLKIAGGCIVVYTTSMLLRMVLTTSMGLGGFYYSRSTNYCYLVSEEEVNSLENLLQIFTAIQLALPILPILVSCCLTTYRLQQFRKKAPSARRMRYISATITILLVTVVYLGFNIPVFANYCYYSVYMIKSCVSWLRKGVWIEYRTYYSSAFLVNYSWGITYVLCVVLNASINPVVYFARMLQFKKFVSKNIWNSTKRTFSFHTSG